MASAGSLVDLSVAQTRPAERPRSAAAAFAEAIRILTDEARNALSRRQLPRATPDFASEFKDSLPPQLLSQKIIRSLHSDPFIDAYIRWQLTSFNPRIDFEKMPDRQFEHVLDDLPVFGENPDANPDLIRTMQAASAAGALNETQLAALNAKLNDLTDRGNKAADLNYPVFAFRIWLESQLPKTGHRLLLTRIELCAASISAGWPVDHAKQKLEEAISASAHDRAFSDQQRRTVVNRLQPLAGKRRLMVAYADIREGALSVEYADTAIYDFEVRRWSKSIERE